MGRPHKHLRGLSNLRTHSGLGSRDVAPHTAFMKITSLELEKLRLSRVRQNAVRRIAEIDARCEDIQVEKTALLAATAAHAIEPGRRSQPGAPARGFTPRRASGLALRY